jgi:hypothetical protein
MIKKAILLIVALLLFVPSIQGAMPDKHQIDLFEIGRAEPLWSAPNTEAIQHETHRWVRTITGFYEGNLSEVNFARGEYCLRVPTEPIRVKNEIIDTTIQNVFLYLGDGHKPALLLFDVDWPARYLVYFDADVRPFLKKLGIWETLKGKRYE